MKIGDKVRFLNTTGGGIVTGFKGKDIVIVDDNGFDTPVLIRECVVIAPANEAQISKSVTNVEHITSAPVSVQKPVLIEETKEGEQITVCLAYLPLDIKNLNTTGYECYLINDSNYYLSYNYMSRGEDGWVSRSLGVVEPNIKLFLEEFEKADLNEIEKICLQFIAYKKDKSFKLKNPYSVELRIDTVKFYKLHSFRDNDYFEDEALIYPVVRKDLADKELFISPEDLSRAMMEKEPSRPTKQAIVKKEATPVLEVDLHIDELLDDESGLSANDMLEYQLKKFREIMQEYKSRKGQKIVFIHGKGNGTLKNKIMSELKTKYTNVFYQDASFREYGFGATMVTIK